MLLAALSIFIVAVTSAACALVVGGAYVVFVGWILGEEVTNLGAFLFSLALVGSGVWQIANLAW